MPRNKPRLQLALYARPKHPGTYHYALFISQKSTKQQQANSATKHHVKNTLQNISGELTQPWRYERLAISDVQLEQRLLVRIVIAKVTSPDALERILEAVPVYQIDDPDRAKAQSFTCLTWVRAALEELGRQGAVAGLGEWEGIHKKALEYVERKKDMGRWDAGWKGEAGVPMLDLLDGREVVG
ncbi:hypothetical protein BU26DRAFT_515866 [Trematosphaeria pertusa]|uniref:Uncharacterized protein n=1 Tax=Trematosphaeria pertusa TaxID=390896 RepID=A0A6A6ITN3_9PLEO|nr:uncharacterized protein BU26DRAFT_515866 [Trematosphaeria pertusa]KAF2253518.1 hypothetical protein BU26DRAFT_515866 [Trematosphaeria pertusa]